MTTTQLTIAGGAVILAFMGQGVLAVAYVLVVFVAALDSTNSLLVLGALWLAAMFQRFFTTVQKG